MIAEVDKVEAFKLTINGASERSTLITARVPGGGSVTWKIPADATPPALGSLVDVQITPIDGGS